MSILIMTRGIPASGKTTWARAWVGKDRAYRARVNRDDIRAMMDDGEFTEGVTEPRVIMARDAMITALLKAGISVVCDETGIGKGIQLHMQVLAGRAGATFRVEEFDVPLETCLERNATRTGKAYVPPDRIVEMRRKLGRS